MLLGAEGLSPLDRVVIVGASLAAVHAIEGLRSHGFQGEIVLIGAEKYLPYDRPPLSKNALRNGPEHEALPLRDPLWYDESGVRLLLGAPARELNISNRTVTLEGGDVVGYDGLVIATGSHPRPVPGANGLVHLLRTIDDCATLHEELVSAKHVVIVGAGFIGLEVAATAREMGLDVSVVEIAPEPLSRILGDEVGEWLRGYHAKQGVNLYCGSTMATLRPHGDGVSVSLDGTRMINADLVVGGVGAAPSTDWLKTSGLRLSDGVLCDSALRTSAPDVVAAGDVARWYHPLFDEVMRLEQWINAAGQGRHAAMTLLGESDSYNAVPYLWTDQFDAKVRFVGRANAADQIHVEQLSEDSLVAVFGRNGVQVGALCINASRQLPRHRNAILGRAPWADALVS